MRKIRLILWALVALAALVLMTVFFLKQGKPLLSALSGDKSEALSTLENDPLYLGSPFELIDHQGQSITQDYFTGHPSILFFGFTHCPDVCPTTLNELSLLYDQLDSVKREQLRIAFVTIDPSRDTPQIMASYVENFTLPVRGITGDEKDVYKLSDSWSIYREKVPLSEGGYTMNHTASVFLIKPDGALRSTITFGEDSAVALEKINNLLELVE